MIREIASVGSYPQACNRRLSRRVAIKALGLGVLGFPFRGLLQNRAYSAEPKPIYSQQLSGLTDRLDIGVKDGETPTSVILVYLEGGIPQQETFDPKPYSSTNIRGEYGAIQTTIPGLIISEHLPELAKVMDQALLIKTVTATIPQADHDFGLSNLFTGSPILNNAVQPPLPKYPGIHTSLVSSGAISTSNMATFNTDYYTQPYSVVKPKSTVYSPNGASKENGFTSPYGEPANQKELQRRIKLKEKLEEASGFKIENHRTASYDQYFGSAIDCLDKDLAEAFDLSNKDLELLRNEFGRTAYGNAALTAIGLARKGVKLIVIQYGGWDLHFDIYHESKGVKRLLPRFDKTSAALIRRAEEEGIIVAFVSEFGRTPELNDGFKHPQYPMKPGRDHYAEAFPVLLAGKRIPKGKVLGETDKFGRPTSDSDRFNNSLALSTIFDRANYVIGSSNRPHPVWKLE